MHDVNVERIPFQTHSDPSLLHLIVGIGIPNAEQNMTAVSDGIIV